MIADRLPVAALAAGTFFVSQVGLATGRARIADAAAAIGARLQAGAHV